MILSEDVFDDTVPPRLRLLLQCWASTAIAFSWLVSIFMLVARPDDGLPDHWKWVWSSSYSFCTSSWIFSSSFLMSDVQWAFILRCFSLCPFNSRTTPLCLRLISSSNTLPTFLHRWGSFEIFLVPVVVFWSPLPVTVALNTGYKSLQLVGLWMYDSILLV